jgi:ABC-type branched-subunit amino acid transport system ATPase component
MESFEPSGGYEVIFAAKDTSPKLNQVVIYPDGGRWNDFGFFIHCRFKVLFPSSADFYRGKIFLAFLSLSKEGKSDRMELATVGRSLASLLSELGREEFGPEDAPQFFSMLPDMAEYRKVVSAFGVDKADQFLRSLNDLVVSRDTKSSWFKQAIATEVFSRGFMRNSEPFFAFHNADSVLNGVKAEDLSAVSKSIDLSFSLKGFSNRHQISLRFGRNSLIPRRINVLIGKNGLGKSQVLKTFCRAALGYKDKNVTFKDSETGSTRPMISRVLAVTTPGETRNTFPAERKKTQKLFYRRLQLARNGSSKLSNSIGASLVQLVRKREVIGDNKRWDIFVESLAKVLPVGSVVVPKKNGASLRLLDLAKNDGEQDSLDMFSNIDLRADPKIRIGGAEFPLSSGQLTFFKFALLCSLYIENGSFVLMDEPETHMHPNMISDFVDLLDNLLEKTGSQAILATHSAYFVREIPKQQVHVFQQNEEYAINISQPRLSTFGSTLDSISQFVFNEDVEVRLTNKIFENAKGMSFNQVDEQLSNEISLAALMDLKRRFEDEV